MASSKEYLDFILEQLSGLNGVRYRAMMGEYILYYQGRIVGGIYDDRLLLKPTPSALALLRDAERDIPYEGAKEMLVADVDDAALTCRAVEAIAADLPAPNPKRKKGRE